jgi:hypothetical protein
MLHAGPSKVPSGVWRIINCTAIWFECSHNMTFVIISILVVDADTKTSSEFDSPLWCSLDLVPHNFSFKFIVFHYSGLPDPPFIGIGCQSDLRTRPRCEVHMWSLNTTGREARGGVVNMKYWAWVKILDVEEVHLNMGVERAWNIGRRQFRQGCGLPVNCVDIRERE